MTEQKEKTEPTKGVSRREFIAGTVGGVVVGAVVGAAAGSLGFPKTVAQTQTQTTTATSVTTAQPWLPASWDYTADVVVVGFGGAGAVTAITASDAGARVIVLEKAPVEGGGSSRCSGGFITVTTSDKVNDAALCLYTACAGETPMDVCQAWATETAKTPDWLTKMGINWVYVNSTGSDFQNFPGASALYNICMTDKPEGAMNLGGGVFWKWATTALQNRGIQILFNTPATALIQNSITKEILGVTATSGSKAINVKASRAVVLCTGGFEFNEAMQANYIRPYPLKGVGWQYNSGDGIKMAQAVGADLWHMNLVCSAGETFVSPSSPIGWWGGVTTATATTGTSFIWVNRLGKRFTCESPSYDMHRAFMGFDQWDWSDTQSDARYLPFPFYMIFDEKLRKAGPLYIPATMGVTTISAAVGGITQPWSTDNSTEIANGWIMQGADLPSLAASITKVEPTFNSAQFQATVATWNEYCQAGMDPDFGRPYQVSPPGACPCSSNPVFNMSAIDTPPFYAIPIWPSVYSTAGGPRKNAKAQILDTNQNPIPRLYEAGALGHTAANVCALYGQNWAEIHVFGRIAGTNAVAETPWT